MKRNIYWHELRRKAHSVLYWSLGIVALNLLYMSIYPGFASQATELRELMKNFPPELMEAFGLNQVDFAQMLGFYSMIFLMTQIILAIQAGNYGVGLVSAEESERTADFLLAMPVSRWQILNSKLLASLTALLVTQVATWASAFGFIALFHGNHPYDAGVLALILFSTVPFQLFFLSVGLAISQMVRMVRSVTPYSLGLGLGMYTLGAFGNMAGEVKLEWITPFKHFDAAYIVRHHHYDTRLLLLDVIITVAALAFGYWRYLRRDIPTVL